MKQILILLMSFMLISCGGNKEQGIVTNAHEEGYGDLRWSKNTNFPLIIKVPSDIYQDNEFREALTNATNTWNDALRDILNEDALKIESFDNNIQSQVDLEESVLSLKCLDKMKNSCKSVCETNDENCTGICSQCYIKQSGYARLSLWEVAQKNHCIDVKECVNDSRPLQINDYLKDSDQVVSQQEKWFSNSSDLTIAITAYSFFVDSKLLTNADIIFNKEYYNFSKGNTIFANQIDFESALLHELGHFLGLGHIDDERSVMFQSLSKGTLNKRTLSDKDIDAIRKKYQ